MKIKDLIKRLQSVSNKEAEIECLVYHKIDGSLIVSELTGPSTTELVKLLGKRKP